MGQMTACVGSTGTQPQNAGIYVLHRNGITKLNAHSHKVLWQAWPEEAKQDESAAFDLTERLASDGERLYVSGFLIGSRKLQHLVYAYSVNDGRQVWSRSFPAYSYVDKFPCQCVFRGDWQAALLL